MSWVSEFIDQANQQLPPREEALSDAVIQYVSAVTDAQPYDGRSYGEVWLGCYPKPEDAAAIQTISELGKKILGERGITPPLTPSEVKEYLTNPD